MTAASDGTNIAHSGAVGNGVQWATGQRWPEECWRLHQWERMMINGNGAHARWVSVAEEDK
jgi:hypothetical protein